MISRLTVTCEDKELTKTCGSFMIVRMTEQYTICGHNEMSDCKILFVFIIYDIIKYYTTCEDMKHYDFKTCGIFHCLSKIQFVDTDNTLITKSFSFCYLEDDRT